MEGRPSASRFHAYQPSPVPSVQAGTVPSEDDDVGSAKLLAVSPVTEDTVSMNTGSATADSPAPTRMTITTDESDAGTYVDVGVALEEADVDSEDEPLLDDVADEEPVLVWLELADMLDEREAVPLLDGVPEGDGVPVPVEDAEPVPVEVTEMVRVPVAEVLPVPVLEADPVDVELDVEVIVPLDVDVIEPVALEELVPVLGREPVPVAEALPVPVAEVEPVPVAEPLLVLVALNDDVTAVADRLDVADRVSEVVLLRVALPVRLRVAARDAVAVPVRVPLRVMLGVTTPATAGRATPRSRSPSNAVNTTDEAPLVVSMRYSVLDVVA